MIPFVACASFFLIYDLICWINKSDKKMVLHKPKKSVCTTHIFCPIFPINMHKKLNDFFLTARLEKSAVSKIICLPKLLFRNFN